MADMTDLDWADADAADLAPLESIFSAAIGRRDPEARAAYLSEACGPDAALRARVERMLAAHGEAGSFLESPPPGLGATAVLNDVPAAESAGTTIGPYALLQKLGEGGMGTVWAAEQHAPVRRRVALKLIKPGMDSAQVLRRFEAERQALALMDHPNIAKVFDAGTTDAGRPYFAMELVKGVPITRYCDELGLTVRERLELFVPVCRAIQHAHTKGVVHRDVKPSNVLVAVQDGRPVPKVIDFGVAKALHQKLADRTVYTEVGGVIGTLEYMAPEQAELSALDVDTRADVYALGALLYELLTGSPPLDRHRLAAAGLAEVVRIIKEEEPRKPSTRLSESAETLPGLAAHRRTEPSKLAREVRGDLDWIVMKCLEKDRSRRYETANGLARDVERHLSDEPVEARPPGRSYRLRKFAKRNKGPLAAAVLVALTLVAGAAAATWQAVRATKAEALAETRYEDERAARKDADAARKAADAERKAAQAQKIFAEAQRTVAETEAAKATAVSDLLQEMLSSANPDQAKGAVYTVRQLLDDSAARLRDQLEGQPEVEAAVRAAIGNAYRRLGATDRAEPHLARALEIRRATPGPREELLAQSLLDYGWNLHEAKDGEGAERHARQAVAIYRRLGVEGEQTLQALAALLLFTHAQGDFEEAERVGNEAIALGRKLFPQGHAELANVLHRLAVTKHTRGELAAAEELAGEAVAMHERRHGPQHVETAHGLSILASIQIDSGRPAEAEANLRRAGAIFERLVGYDHSWSRTNEGKLERAVEAARGPAALAELRAERMARVSAQEGGAAATTQGALRLAELWLDAGLWDRARAQLDAAGRLPDAGVQDAERLANGYARLADGLGKAGNRAADEAAARAEQVRWRERLLAFGSNPSRRGELAFALAFYGFALEQSGRPEEAAAALAKAVGLYNELRAEEPANLWHRFCRAFSGRRLATILGSFGRFEEAIALARESVRLNDALVAEVPDRPEYLSDAASAHRVLISLLIDARRDHGEEFRDLLASDRPGLHDEVAFAYGERGRWAESAAAFRRGLDLDPSDAARWFRYASLRLELGDEAGYRTACREMLSRFADTNDLVAADVTVKTCSLVPGAVEDFRAVAVLADRAAALFGKNPYDWFAFAKALADYRTGRPDEAARWLERFPSLDRIPEKPLRLALLALIEQGRGRTDESLAALRQAQEITAREMPDPAAGRRFHPQGFQDWLHAGRLCREAEARLRESTRETILEWERLAAADPNPAHRNDLASAYARHGAALDLARRPAEAADAFAKALGIWEELSSEDPRNRTYRRERATFSHRLADVLTKLRRAEEAIEWARTSVRLGEELVAEAPDEPDHRDRLADARASLARLFNSTSRWADAAALLEGSIETAAGVSPTEEYLQWYRAATARALAGDREAYDRLCRRMLDRYSASADLQAAQLAARGSLLLSGTPPYRDEAVRLAERSIDAAGGHAAPPYNLLTRSLAEYRAGRHEQAVEWNAAALARGDMPAIRRAAHQFVQAMALSRLGRAGEARAALEEGLKLAPTGVPAIAADPVWYLLRREAVALLPAEAARPTRE